MKPFLFALVAATLSYSQVPPDIAKQLVTIGRGVCVPETYKLYRPLHKNPPYSGISITRDVSFGPDPMDVLDVFSAEKGGGNRPVLIYVSGGAGNKLGNGPDGIFYDNVMLWAVSNGMVGVNMQRHGGQEWNDPGRAVGMLVKWVGENISKHKGNPTRVFIWSQSAGNAPVATYIGHSDLWTPKGLGLKGVVFMSSPGFSILPATPPATQGGNAFGACMDPNPNLPGPPGAPAAAGRGGAKGGAAKGGAPGGGGRGKAAPLDEATQLARSNLKGIIDSKIPVFVSSAELDPPGVIAFAETLRDALAEANRNPTYMNFKDHSHISEVMSIDTPDTSVSGPILKWIKTVK